jgi:hypothetical protein
MRARSRILGSGDERIGRGAYLLSGVLIFGLSEGLDWTLGFRSVGAVHGSWFLLGLVSVPLFLAFAFMTAWRLEDVGASPKLRTLLIGCSLVPIVRGIVFGILASLPSRKEGAILVKLDRAPEKEPEPSPPLLPLLEGWLPDSPLGRQLLATVGAFGLPLAATVAFSVLPRSGLPWARFMPRGEVLGWGLFVGTPFAAGVWAGFVTSYGRTTGVGRALGSAFVAYAAVMLALFVLAFEGIACIAMAAPLLLPCVLLGALVGHVLGRARRPEAAALAAFLGLLLLAHDFVSPPPPVRFRGSVAVRVHASPEVVFENVAAISPVDEPPSWLHAIHARHVESKLDGRGVGARRRCVYSVGDMEERIVRWEPGREVAFVVDRVPGVIARCAEPEWGRFVLTPNGDGTTTVTAEGEYSVKIFPAAYWGLWTQTFLREIQLRGLEHAKRMSETPAPVRRRARPAPMPEWMELANATCACTRHAPGR